MASESGRLAGWWKRKRGRVIVIWFTGKWLDLYLVFWTQHQRWIGRDVGKLVVGVRQNKLKILVFEKQSTDELQFKTSASIVILKTYTVCTSVNLTANCVNQWTARLHSSAQFYKCWMLLDFPVLCNQFLKAITRTNKK